MNWHQSFLYPVVCSSRANLTYSCFDRGVCHNQVLLTGGLVCVTLSVCKLRRPSQWRKGGFLLFNSALKSTNSSHFFPTVFIQTQSWFAYKSYSSFVQISSLTCMTTNATDVFYAKLT